MHIMINIDEEDYKIMKHNVAVDNPLCPLNQKEMVTIIANGVPLPERHGRLVDAESLDKSLKDAQVNLEDELSKAFDDGLTWASEMLNNTPTIVKEDK